MQTKVWGEYCPIQNKYTDHIVVYEEYLGFGASYEYPEGIEVCVDCLESSKKNVAKLEREDAKAQKRNADMLARKKRSYENHDKRESLLKVIVLTYLILKALWLIVYVL